MSEPVTPRTLYGLGVDELEQWCADLVAAAGQQVDEKGRKQRKDTAILMGVVASYPGPPDEVDPNYVRWKALNVAYFCEKFGPNVVSIVEHLDENMGTCTCWCRPAGARSSPCIRATRRRCR